jgi:hypothetical protein
MRRAMLYHDHQQQRPGGGMALRDTTLDTTHMFLFILRGIFGELAPYGWLDWRILLLLL